MGVGLYDKGELVTAVAAFRDAISIRGNYADAYVNMGVALKNLGSLDEAIASYRKATMLTPCSFAAQSNLINCLHFHPMYDAGAIASECARWNERCAKPLRASLRPHTNDADPGRPLRIGYVSPNLCRHVVGYNLLPLLKRCDRERFEIFCYSGVIRGDAMTQRFQALSDKWCNTVGVPDEKLANAIRADGVDVLVDLTLHMADNRLPVFARKPAPVQVSFAGYPGSTGLETIDYRLTDRYLEPPALLPDYGGEQAIYLAHSFWCYEPDGTEPEGNSLPAMERGYVTFGCLNNFCKVNEPMLGLWARVLGQVKGARLMILAKEGSHRQRTVDKLARAGVSPECIEFVGFRPRREYLGLYHQVDIALDTFPYNGHTTSLDALWMGVPVVSLSGETPVSRAGLSQLSNLGMPELVTPSRDDYVHIAVALAHDLPRLSELRSTLRARMRASPLTHAPGFARSVEDGYRLMWRRWCAAQRG